MPSNYVLTPAAVRKLRGALAHPSGNTGATLRSATISPDEFPPPFAVRWSASETSGGTWTIWLPDRAKLVAYGDAYVATITGVAACQNLPTGYYTVTALSASSTSVYLNVTITDATGSAAAELSDAAGTASSGETVYSILVATMATDANTGAKLVKQFVDSAVLIGKGGETVTPDDVSTEFIPDPPSGQSPTGDEGKLQIKGWQGGTPTASYSLADELTRAGSTAKVVTRNSDGTLEYMEIGQIQGGGTLPTNTVDVVTGVEYGQYNDGSSTDYRIRIKTQPLGITNGQFVLGVATYSYINTVPLSAEWVSP